MTVQLTGATIFLDDDAEQRRVAFTTCVTLGAVTRPLARRVLGVAPSGTLG